MNGMGKYTWPDGRCYEGPFMNDLKHGSNGTYRWPNGQVYTGDMQFGKQHGLGQLTFPSGQKREA